MGRFRDAPSTFDRRPVTQVSDDPAQVSAGWIDIADRIRRQLPNGGRTVIAVECYPGVDLSSLASGLAGSLAPDLLINVEDCTRSRFEIADMLQPHVTDDRVFGLLSHHRLVDFYDEEKLQRQKQQIEAASGILVVFGHGATLACDPDILVLADLPRWEVEQRHRAGRTNWQTDNADEDALRKFKRGYFIEWRIADWHKQALLPEIDFLLDTVQPDEPKLVAGSDFREALHQVARRPFRLVPCFEPGVWGGQWLREVCDLPDGPPNYAWSFDCIVEANSLLLGFGDRTVEIPAIDLVLMEPEALLGARVYARFGPEFPIRFNFLDTMDGGNLSLQVHPRTEYMHRVFGFRYTQDESYYLMDAGEDACVYLGVTNGTAPETMMPALEAAQAGGADFDDSRFVNRWPAKKHDHFLIPAGTVHCSGRNTVVLEISSTPYVFTFKLWDWGRVGMDGRPRPVHLGHGRAAIQFERDMDWTRRELINRFEPLHKGENWREERTGLHETEFIETRRHWFSGPVPHESGGSVNVVNLCQGDAAVVESPSGAFPPLRIHYAETIVIPAAVRSYTVRPAQRDSGELATIKAFVRA